MPESPRARLVLVDGSGYIFRAFFALPPLTDPGGVPVGAVFGFCNMLFRLVQDMPGDQLLVVFDKGKASFRDAIYADYKANRLEPPDDLVPQFPLVRAATDAFGVPMIELEGYEAEVACKAENPDAKPGALQKCIQAKQRAARAAERAAVVRAAKACRAERTAMGASDFATKYGGKANAFGKCVSKLAQAQQSQG